MSGPPLRVLIAAPDLAPWEGVRRELTEEGLAVVTETDLILLTGKVDPRILSKAPLALVALGGAPAPVLVAAAQGLRAAPGTASTPILVFDPALDLNERARLMAAGVDDCQNRALPGALLSARMRNLLRRAAPAAVQAEGAVLSLGKLRLDLVRRAASIGVRPLSPTRLQFDLLTALARGAESSLPRAAAIAALLRRGHVMDADVLSASLSALNRILLPAGAALETNPEGALRLVDAVPERLLPALAGEFLDALAGLLHDARLYAGEHASVSASAIRAHAAAHELLHSAGQSELRLSAEPDGLMVCGVMPAGEPPRPVLDFMRALDARELGVAAWVAPGEFVAVARQKAEGRPGIRLAKNKAYDLGRAKDLTLEFARLAVADPQACAELFAENAELVRSVRGKPEIAKGREAIAALLARYPRGITIEVASHKGAGETHEAQAVVGGGRLPPSQETYRFTERAGLIARFEIESRLKI